MPLYARQAISRADMVIVMEKGCVMWSGPPAELACSKYSVFSLSTQNSVSHQSPEQEYPVSSGEVREEPELPSAAEFTQEIIEEERRKEGKVELTVYK